MKRRAVKIGRINRWPTILALALVFCLLLCQVIYISKVRQLQREQNLACAQLVVEQASQQFRQAMTSGFDRMRIAASVLSRGDADEAALLTSLKATTGVLDAAIVQDGEMRCVRDGALYTQHEPKTAKRYTISSSTTYVLQEDGGVHLRTAFSGGELAIWLDIDALAARICSIVDGGCGLVVYNSVSGDHLFNRSDISQNYYEYLMTLDTADGVDELFRVKDAVATARLGEDGALSYIAQHQSGLSPWCITLIIPESALPSAQELDMSVPMRVVTIISVLLFIIASGALLMLLRLRSKQDAARKSIVALESMVEQASEQSRTALLIYQRDTEKVPFIRDGMGALRQPRMGDSLEALLTDFSLNQADSERLMDVLHGLLPGEAGEITVNADRGAEEHALSFSLKRMQENAELIAIAVRDCTQERFNRERALEEQHFGNGMRQKSNMIWKCNISRASWQLVFVRGVDPARMGVSENVWRNSEADISGLLRTLIHPEDYADLVSRVRPEAAAEAYQCGRDEMEFEYRMRIPGDKAYSWYRQITRIFRSPETNDIMADAYIINIDAEKRAEMERSERRQVLQQTLTALGGIFYGLYYVDLDKNTSYTVKSLGGDLVTQLHASFEDTFSAFIDQRVHPDDRARLHDLLSCYRLKRMITEEKHFVRTGYRRKSGDQYRDSILLIQAARFENGVIRDVVVALRKNDEENEQK